MWTQKQILKQSMIIDAKKAFRNRMAFFASTQIIYKGRNHAGQAKTAN